MHILIIPSWYPGLTHREGLFIFEQIMALGEYSGCEITVLNWGPNEFVLKLRNPINSLRVFAGFPFQRNKIIRHNENVVEYKIPHITWTILFLKGNYDALAVKLSCVLRSIVHDRGEVDIIHAHVAFPAGYLAMRLSQKLSVPYVITEHSGPFPFKEFETKKGIRPIVTEPLSKAGAILAVSTWLAQRIIEKTELKVTVIPNSVSSSFIHTAQKKPHKNAAPRLFCLSHLTEDKGIGDLLQAVRILKTEGLGFTLRIGGTGPLQRLYRKISTEFGLNSNIVWLGALDRQKALVEFYECDFFIMPSRLETLSMVILEALACGKPIVATDCGGPSDLINASNGILVQASNSIELADGIERMLLTHSNYDAELIRNVCIQNYSPEIIVSRITAIYKTILSQ
jgi:glycosyltransferase involved in cell wall biosynthesis